MPKSNDLIEAKVKKKIHPKQHNALISRINNFVKSNEHDEYIRQKMNEYLKEITAVCGINKTITFHIARHTFATISLGYGVPIETVSKMLGHTDIKTTQIYAKITDRKLSDDMEIMAIKINGRKMKAVEDI